MKASSVCYVRDPKLRGRLFDTRDTSGLVSCVNTGFFVDHEEPLEALAWCESRSTGLWVTFWMAMNSFLFFRPGVGPGLVHRAGMPSLEPRQSVLQILLKDISGRLSGCLVSLTEEDLSSTGSTHLRAPLTIDKLVVSTKGFSILVWSPIS